MGEAGASGYARLQLPPPPQLLSLAFTTTVVESHQQETTLTSAAQLPPPVGPRSSAVSVEPSVAAACSHPPAPWRCVTVPFLGMFNQGGLYSAALLHPFPPAVKLRGTVRGT